MVRCAMSGRRSSSRCSRARRIRWWSGCAEWTWTISHRSVRCSYWRSCSAKWAAEPSSVHRELAREGDDEGEGLRLAARFHSVRNALEPLGNSQNLFLRLTAGGVEPFDRVDRPLFDLLFDYAQVVARTVDPGAADDVGHLAEVWHAYPRHVDGRHDRGGGDERAIRIPLQNLLEDLPVEDVVTRFFLGDVREHDADGGLVLARELAGVRVAHLRRALLQRGVHEDAVRVFIPRRLESRAEILELHALELGIIEELAVAGVVVQHRAMPVLFGRPLVGPLGPEAASVQVDGEEAVEAREPFLGEQVECEGNANGRADAARALA